MYKGRNNTRFQQLLYIIEKIQNICKIFKLNSRYEINYNKMGQLQNIKLHFYDNGGLVDYSDEFNIDDEKYDSFGKLTDGVIEFMRKIESLEQKGFII